MPNSSINNARLDEPVRVKSSVAVWLYAFGCTGEPAAELFVPEGDLEGIEETAEGLTDLSGRCTFGSSTLTCTMVANDIMVISKSSTGEIVINGFKVTTAGVTATSTNTKAIVVNGSTGADDVIVDFSNGTFAVGAATQPSGIFVDLVSGNDFLKLRATDNADRWVFGLIGAEVSGDAFADVTGTHIDGIFIMLSKGNDIFDGGGNTATGGAPFPGPLTVFGGAGDDTIRGGSNLDTLNGGDGNDTFTTGAVADGTDTMNGNAGSDTADYSTRTNALLITMSSTGGEPGENDVFAADIEVIKGGMGNDTLVGDGNANTIFGGPGDDKIDGGLGNDVLNGDAGDDTFTESGTVPSGADTFNGGAGTDKVDYGTRTASVIIHMENLAADDGEVGELDKIGGDVENVTTGSGNDTITGSSGKNVILSNAGNDTIFAGAGDDVINSGTGTDVSNGEAGNDLFLETGITTPGDTFNCGSGIDTINYASRMNAITVTMDGVAADDGEGGVTEGDNIKADCEDLIGGSAADQITGNASANRLEGGSLNAIDTINGLDGDDIIDGGGGVDVIDCGLGEDIKIDTESGTSCEL